MGDWESSKYGKKNADRYPHYLLFFANLYNHKTKLHVLTLSNDEEGKYLAKVCEKVLIAHCLPLWEEMKNLYINYLRENSHIKANEYGNALKTINEGHNNSVPNFIELDQSIGKILKM